MHNSIFLPSATEEQCVVFQIAPTLGVLALLPLTFLSNIVITALTGMIYAAHAFFAISLRLSWSNLVDWSESKFTP